jgi:acyl-CoA reductase-like NAD-dependent aldehyde dehydrogenase
VDQIPDVRRLFDAQRDAFRRRPNPPAAERRAHLTAIVRLMIDEADAMASAISADFGHRSHHETKVLEVLPALLEAKHARSHVGRWMRPERKATSLWFQPGRTFVVKQPLGVAGIIVPWNYPLLLSAAPLVAALAAGNRAMVKISELTPRFGETLARLIARSFPEDQVAIVNGGVDVAQTFAALPFDHLLFTGSTAVGRHVMRAASEHLTPVTLELGGKSPAIVAPGFPIDVAARRIVWGKCINAGQTCIAPDYVLIPEAQLQPFVEAAGNEVRRLSPDGVESDDYSAVINARHYRRLTDYAADASAKGARIVALTDGASEAARKMPPTIVTGVDDRMRIMQEEIFGPLLPIKTYGHLDEALAYVADRPRPLAMYYFDDDAARTERVLAESIAGDVTVNDTILHIAQTGLPFGGVGSSGMGQYHGEDGFLTFSKRKGVFVQSRFNATWLLKPPFGTRVERMLRLILR